MIKVVCSLCPMELHQPGALLFSPPEDDFTQKRHICVLCWQTKILPLFSNTYEYYDVKADQWSATPSFTVDEARFYSEEELKLAPSLSRECTCGHPGLSSGYHAPGCPARSA